MKLNTKVSLIILWIASIPFFTGCGENGQPSQAPDGKLFQSLEAAKTNITFKNNVVQTERINYFNYQYVLNGAGVAVGDLNKDGLPDLYFASNQNANHLYLNQGDLRFTETAAQSGVQGNATWATGVSIVDVNSDGWNDIYVCHAGNYLNKPDSLKNELFINNGDADKNNGIPTFTESADKFGLAGFSRTTQAYFFDYDRDNDLDIFLVNHPYNFWLPIDMRVEAESSPYPDETDQLFRNDGNGVFTDVTNKAGLTNWAFGLSASISDFNQDDWPDIYVCNDYSEKDELYLNNQDGTFSKSVDSSMFHISNFSMGSDASDYNNDLMSDLIVLDMMAEDNRRKKINMSAMKPEVFWDNVALGRHYQYMQNTLQLNNGNGTFSEVAELANVAFTDWSWAPLFADFDNDGLKDLFVSNGIALDIRNTDANKPILGRDLRELRANFQEHLNRLPSEPVANYAYQNKGDLTFEKVAQNWGLDYAGFSTSAVYADLDNDGDLDLVLNNVNDTSLVYENTQQNNNYIKLNFLGPDANKAGIGVKVVVHCSGKSQVQELVSARGFMGGMDKTLHFGLGKETKMDSLEVTWPDGKVQKLNGLNANQTLTLLYAEAKNASLNKKEVPEPFFNEVELISFSHKELLYDDYSYEVLLPHKYSQLGPFSAVGDVNQDGLDDVLIGGARGQSAKLFIQQKDGLFKLNASQPWLQHKEREDTGVLFFDVDNDSDLDIFIGSGSNEWEDGSPNYQDRIYFNDGQGNFMYRVDALPNTTISSSVAIAHDYDSDGDLDLFVGGRLVPRKYPLPAASKILQNENGKFKDVTQQVAPSFDTLGLVTSAIWFDVNGDEKAELVVAGEWMSIKVYSFQNDAFADITENAGFLNQTGWWQQLEAADLDNDGDLDLVAGNFGLNTKYKATFDKPFHVYYNDFDANGRGDIVLSYEQNDQLFTVRGRSCSAQQVPSLKKKFPTYEMFGAATVEDVFGEGLIDAIHLTANTMATTVFWNDGKGVFEPQTLPNEAQVSVTNGIVTVDVNKDGLQDFVLSGNNYQAETETCRHDASIGCVLLNLGNREFKPLSASESGFVNVGDARHLNTFTNANGEANLIVTNNDSQIRCFLMGKNFTSID